MHVLTVITGGVRSNIVRQVDPELPPNSLYQPIHDFWLRRVRVSQEESPMDTTAYAESVVRQVVARTRKPWFWQGSFAWIAWTIDTFLWRGFAARPPPIPLLPPSPFLPLPCSPTWCLVGLVLIVSVFVCV